MCRSVFEVFQIVLVNFKSIMTLLAYLSGFTFLRTNKLVKEFSFIKLTMKIVRNNLIKKVSKRQPYKS